MFKKPKFTIGQEVYVVIRNDKDAEVHKTVVEHFKYEFTKGWSVRVKKTWRTYSPDLYYSLVWRGMTEISSSIPVSNVFSTEEEAKEYAVTYVQTIKENIEEEKQERLKTSLKEAQEEKKTLEKKIKEIEKQIN